MGVVVRTALDGDATDVDDSEMLLAALQALDAPHFAALEPISRQFAELGEDVAGVGPNDVLGFTSPVRAALLAVGAIDQQSGFNGIFYRSSDFGERLLALVTV